MDSPARHLGPFHLNERIGRGGMGEVWRARHAAMGVEVAIKLLTSERATDPQYRQAFADEVRAAAALTHPNVVTIFDYGTPTEGTPWLAMELVSGGTLLDRCARADWSEVRSVLDTLLSALAHAHARGVLHRDLKPENVLLAGPRDLRPGLKIADFGLATQVWAAGTPGYSPPEQVRGEWHRQGPWTDLFALGRLAMALVAGDPEAAHPAIPVPTEFEAWVARCCAVDPRDRFPCAADAATALALLGDALEPTATPMAAVQRVASQPTWTSDLDFSPTELADPMADVRAVPPRDWRGTEAAPERMALEWIGAGLGLLGLRTVPLVGRQTERDVLWNALLRVVDTGQPGLVVLRGTEGIGTSRLTAWIAERAHETGAATPLIARHGPQGSERPRGPFTRLSGGVLSVPAISELTRERPVVLVLDDAHYAADSLRTAARLLSTSLPVLVVIAARTEVLAERPEENTALDRLTGAPGAVSLPIGPLDPALGLALVQALIGADPTLATQVQERAQGNPRLAIRHVQDWVNRGLIRAGPYGFRLIAEPPKTSFDDAEQWAGRIATFLADASPDDANALELAAVLGPVADLEEWGGLCEAAGTPPSAGLIRRLTHLGLARARRGGWSFAHELARQAVLDRAESTGRLGAHHRRCAEGLEPSNATHHRIGRHWLAAGEPGKAAKSLRKAADILSRSMQYYAALRCMDDWHAAMVEAGVEADDERWADGWFQRGHLCLDAGRVDQALAIARRSVAAVEWHGWTNTMCDAHYLLGKVLFSRGELAPALKHLRIAEAHVTEARAPDVHSVIGDVLVDQGELTEAEACFRAAAEMAAERGSVVQQARAYYCLGFTALQAGNLDLAAEHLNRSTSFGTDAAGWITGQAREMLARVERARGDLDAAEAHLLAARPAFERRGDGHGITGFLGVVQVERGDTGRARPLLEYALATSRRLGRHSAVATLLGPLLTCLARDSAWLELDEARLELADLIDRFGMAEADCARYLLLASDAARDRGQAQRAVECARIARDQAVRLGRQDLIDRADARI